MLDHYALRISGGTGSIDDVSGIRRTCQTAAAHDWLALERIFEAKDTRLDWRQPIEQLTLCQHYFRAAIREKERETLRGIVRVERHIRASRLPNRKNRHDQIGRARKTQTHSRLGTDVQRQELRGDSVGFCIEFTVCHALVAENERHSPGRFLHPLREQLVDDRYLNLGLRLAAVPVDENLLAFLPCEEWKAGEMTIGISRSALEQSYELIGEPLHS